MSKDKLIDEILRKKLRPQEQKEYEVITELSGRWPIKKLCLIMEIN
jgi:hypothetical protein